MRPCRMTHEGALPVTGQGPLVHIKQKRLPTLLAELFSTCSFH